MKTSDDAENQHFGTPGNEWIAQWIWHWHVSSSGILHVWELPTSRPSNFDDTDNAADDPAEQDRE